MGIDVADTLLLRIAEGMMKADFTQDVEGARQAHAWWSGDLDSMEGSMRRLLSLQYHDTPYVHSLIARLVALKLEGRL